MQLRAVLFDFDGTLVSSVEMYVRIFDACLREQHVEPQSYDAIRHLALQPLAVIFTELAPILDVEEFKRSFLARELEMNTTEHLPLVAGTTDVLAFLREKQLKTGIVSSKIRAPIEEMLATYDLTNYFDQIIGRDDVTATKPDPEPVHHACALLHIQPHDTLFVGDSLLDLTAAKEAGSTFVGVLTGAATRHDFEHAKADYILNTVSELTGIVRRLVE